MIYKLVFIPYTSLQTQETSQKFQLSPPIALVSMENFGSRR